MQTPIIELVIFKTKPGISRQAVQRAAQKANGFLEKSDGFVHRELAVQENGGEWDKWVDIVHWRDRDSAQRAAQAFLLAPECRELMSAIDGPPQIMLHCNSCLTYSGPKEIAHA